MGRFVTWWAVVVCLCTVGALERRGLRTQHRRGSGAGSSRVRVEKVPESSTVLQSPPFQTFLDLVDDETYGSYCSALLPDESNYDDLSSHSKLLMIQVVSRHGDRAPIHATPSDLQSDWQCTTPQSQSGFGFTSHFRTVDDFIQPLGVWQGNCYKGQLTTTGFDQMYQLGRQISNVYSRFIPLEPSNIYSRTTTISRAVDSAQAFAAGILESRGGMSADYTLHEPDDNSRDKLFLWPRKVVPCPKLKKLKQDIKLSPHWQEHMARHSNIHEKLTEMTGTAGFREYGDNLQSFAYLMHARACHGMEVPCMAGNDDCLSEDEFKQLYAAALWEQWYSYVGYDRKSRVTIEAGPLLKTLLNNMKEAAHHGSDKEAKTVFHYSTHDTTLMAMMAALSADPFLDFPYASNVVFELWRHTDSFVPYVRILVNGVKYDAPCLQNSGVCALGELAPMLTKFIPIDWDNECAA